MLVPNVWYRVMGVDEDNNEDAFDGLLLSIFGLLVLNFVGFEGEHVYVWGTTSCIGFLLQWCLLA